MPNEAEISEIGGCIKNFVERRVPAPLVPPLVYQLVYLIEVHNSCVNSSMRNWSLGREIFGLAIKTINCFSKS